MTKDLMEARTKGESLEITDEQWNKVKGECEPGCIVFVYWMRNEYEVKMGFDQTVDDGYVFVLPGMDAQILDAYFHVPYPANPGGKDTAPPEWGYVLNLLDNPLVERIEFKTPVKTSI